MTFGEAIDEMRAGATASRYSWAPGSFVRVERLILTGTTTVDSFLANRQGWHNETWSPSANDMLAYDWFIVQEPPTYDV